VLEARQRGAVWLSFVVGAGLAALLQSPGPERRIAIGGVSHQPSSPIVETSPETGDGRFGESIAVAAMRHRLDPALVEAVIAAESGYDPLAVSPKGAVGLMQILPETAALMGLPAPADPAANLEAGCRYLAALQDNFGGDVELALAAYNAGPGAVRRWGTVPPYRETRVFVRRVADTYRRLTGLDVSTASRFTNDASAGF
jgi:soluble lytic murein transglycosylase-like protein